MSDFYPIDNVLNFSYSYNSFKRCCFFIS